MLLGVYYRSDQKNVLLAPMDHPMDSVTRRNQIKWSGERSHSLFSEDEILPKRYKRIRDRQHKPMHHDPCSGEEQSSFPSLTNVHAPPSSALNNNDNEKPNDARTQDLPNQTRQRKLPTAFGAEKSYSLQSSSLVRKSNFPQNESIGPQSSTTERLLEDVEKLKELIFLRDIQLGFLPDECEVEFESCFIRFSRDERFAVCVHIYIVH